MSWLNSIEMCEAHPEARKLVESPMRCHRIMLLPVTLIALVHSGCRQEAASQPQAADPQPSQAVDEQAVDEQVVGEVAVQTSDWPIYRGDAGLRGVSAEGVTPPFGLDWTFRGGAAIVSSPIIVDDNVYIGCDDGRLYCLDVHTGEKRWEFVTEYELEAPPLYHDGVIYIGSSDFFVYAVDAANGELRWKFETNDTVLGGANVITNAAGETLILVGSYDSSLYALDAATGELRWRYETLDRIHGTPAVTAAGHIVVGGCDTAVYVIDAEGALVRRIELGGECFIAASVAVDGGYAFAGHHDGGFVCVDLEAGEVVWEYENPRFGFFSPPAVNDEVVLVGGRDSNVHCIDRATGEPRWKFPTRRKVDGGIVIAGPHAIFGSGDGRLYLVDIKTGEEVWNNDLGQSIFSSPAVAKGRIIIGCNDGGVYAYTSTQGRP